MVFHKAFHGAYLYIADGHTQRIGGLSQFIGKTLGQRAYKVYRHPWFVVTYDITGKELRKTLDKHFVHTGYITFVYQESGKTCYIAVGQWLAIHILYNYVLGKGVFLHEFRANRFGKLALKAVEAESEFRQLGMKEEDRKVIKMA